MKQRLSLFIALLSALLFANRATSQINLTAPLGSGVFGGIVSALPNGNYIIADPEYDDGVNEDVGAVYLINGVTHQIISTLKGTQAGDKVGTYINHFTDAIFAVSSPNWNNKLGAITWCSTTTGMDGEVNDENSLVGTSAEDLVGSFPLLPIGNDNFVLSVPGWDNDLIADVGAVVWLNGTNPLVGPISTTNSLTGSHENDMVGFFIIPLTKGNYVVLSPFWNGDGSLRGAVTWCPSDAPTFGEVSSDNSLVGSTDGDFVGLDFETFRLGIVPLTNGNYVVVSPEWDSGDAVDAGAVTWGNGAVGVKGEISSDNSLVGSADYDAIGSDFVVPLTCGNYVIASSYWDNGDAVDAGAVTWGNGTTGITGEVTSANSLVGSSYDDGVGYDNLIPLPNGNYVVASSYWDNGDAVDAGAVTWGNGTTGITGEVTSANSLVGSSASDYVGNNGVTCLSNDNYVISSPDWNDSDKENVGAATWANGETGISGEISVTNSLIGGNENDYISSQGVVALTNDNYLVSSAYWTNEEESRAGAVTWGNGAIGTIGVVSSSNSLVGSSANDLIGYDCPIALKNGNYIVTTRFWANGSIANAGAATWGNGTTGISGTISETNSLVGSSENDQVGEQWAELTDGSVLILSPSWDGDVGAITYVNAATGLNGTVSECNSIIGKILGCGCSSIIFSQIYDYTILSIPENNDVFIFDPSFKPLTSQEQTQTYTLSGTPGPVTAFVSDDCKVIASIKPLPPTPASGSITAKVWVDEVQPATYVRRHYEITPDENASTAKAAVTLYFTQEDFDEFNSQTPIPPLLLPSDPSDATGISNIRIEKVSGKSNDDSGRPSTYTVGTSNTLDPDEVKIAWNEALDRWEITFTVEGFSGFFLKTLEGPLPVRLVSFSAQTQENSALLQWNIANAVNFSHFEIERSTDGKQFKHVATVGQQGSNYQYTDTEAAIAPVVYYRLKMADLDGTSSYSRIESVRFNPSQLLAVGYPNPFKKTLTLTSASNQTATVTNLTGSTVTELQLTVGTNEITTTNWPVGLYFVRTENGDLIKVIKE
jgi:hypothetical protein